MFKKIVLLTCAIILLSLCSAGCSNALQEENLRLNEAYRQEEAKSNQLATENAVLKQELQDLNQQLEEEVALIGKINGGSAQNIDVFPIYTAYTTNYAREIRYYIPVPKESPLKTKMAEIAKCLSKLCFQGLPIEITSIDQSNIATINLQETQGDTLNSATPHRATWSSNYFQGSTGGTVTSTSLIESFLQREYAGDWITGVRFLYNGRPIDFEHVPELSKVNYR